MASSIVWLVLAGQKTDPAQLIQRITDPKSDSLIKLIHSNQSIKVKKIKLAFK